MKRLARRVLPIIALLVLACEGAVATITPSAIPSTVTPTLTLAFTQAPSKTSTPTATPSVTPTDTPTATPPIIEVTPTPAPADYYVSPGGSDANPGTQSAPTRTIQKAVSLAAPGSTIAVAAGDYAELVIVSKSGLSIVASGEAHTRGFYVTGSGNAVTGFTIENPSSDYGIRVSGNNNTFTSNDISNTRQDGVWFFGAGNRFVGNTIHDIVDRSKITSDPHVDCFQTWGPAEAIVFEKNICDHTSTYGSNQVAQISNLNQPVRSILFRNNVFIMHDPGYSPMTFYHMDGQPDIEDMLVVNNTFVHVNGIGAPAIWFQNIAGAYAINNLFVDYGTGATPYILVDGGSGLEVHNNAIYKTDGVVPLGGVRSGDLWLSAAGLQNYLNGDFRVAVGSALIDAGADASLWVTDDFMGTARPQGAAFDIGAYEVVQ